MAATQERDKQKGRLSDFGHSLTWRRLPKGSVYSGLCYQGSCRRCGGQLECYDGHTVWRAVPGRPSLLRFPGVNIIRRCPGRRR
jgi:hypothetical protein